jgi:YVTN family beta-propeller protein
MPTFGSTLLLVRPVWIAANAPAPIGFEPGRFFAYITNYLSHTVSIIDTSSNMVTATVPAGSYPYGVAVSPDGAEVYVSNSQSNTVSIIDTASNTVTTTIPVGSRPEGVAVTPDGANVYVSNSVSNTVSIIDTASNTVTATVPAEGSYPRSFGQFIGPTAPQPTPAPYDGFLYIDFIGASSGACLPVGKLYISPDSTNPEALGHVELDIGNGALSVPVKQGSYCFISTAQPKIYRLYYQPLVP